MRDKANRIIEKAREILVAEGIAMTVRQIYYQLVARHIIDNSRSEYQAVSSALVKARQDGRIPWDFIEDRLRRPRTVSMWDGLEDFADTAEAAYRRNVWVTQPDYFEVWLEKDALSGIFEDVIRPYGVTLNVGRGYDGWDSIYRASRRYGEKENATVLYFGDFDPSGEDMVRSLEERLNFFEIVVKVKKCALLYEDIERYDLPPDMTKSKDTRSAKFIEKHGDVAVELDALPVSVLRERVENEVSLRIDGEALVEVKKLERKEKKKIRNLLGGVK